MDKKTQLSTQIWIIKSDITVKYNNISLKYSIKLILPGFLEYSQKTHKKGFPIWCTWSTKDPQKKKINPSKIKKWISQGLKSSQILRISDFSITYPKPDALEALLTLKEESH